MPPFSDGAIMHSIVFICSGMSKCTPSTAAIASSAVACIHSRSASLPCRTRDGSLSSLAIASAMVAPGPAISFTIRSCSAAIRASSSSPHS